MLISFVLVHLRATYQFYLMETIKLLLVFFLISTTNLFSQNADTLADEIAFPRIKIVGEPAKLITSWTGETMTDAKGKLANGDKITIIQRQIGFIVNIIQGNVVHFLTNDGSEEELEDFVVHVYEYDFDKDGVNEIIVATSPEFSIIKVEVFKYNAKGEVSIIGEFEGQFDIVLDKNSISLPFGSFGLGNEYTYSKGKFKETDFSERVFEE